MAHNHENEEIVISNLMYLMNMGAYDGHNLLQIPSLNLKIYLYLNRVEEKMVQAIFSVEHPEFEEDIIESVVGVGENRKKTLISAAENFYNMVLIPLLSALNNKKSETIEVFLHKKLHLFKKYESDIFYGGKKENLSIYKSSLFDIIKNNLPKYLGNKKAYLVKIFTSYSFGKYVFEVRINDILIPALTKSLENYIKTWKISENYYSEKQCIFLLQDDSTFEVCPYNRKNINDLTFELIKLLEARENYKTIISKMKGKDITLVQQLLFLIPEIYCEVMLNNINYNDLIVLMKENGKNEIIHSNQIRIYNYIKEAIYAYLEDVKPSDQNILNILCLSERFATVNKQFQDGHTNFENIETDYIILPIDKNYKLF